jgi:ATP/maltotriose-dependent transcriptional regulator MalT
VADGGWRRARELPWVASSRAQRRAAALRPQERLAELLGARGEELLCEELALRARLDLDQGRLPLAAHELDAALSAAEDELGAEANPALAPRVDELRALHAAIGEEPDVEQVRHALERLEAALRARTAGGFSRG